jgi:hypothetical protein
MTTDVYDVVHAVTQQVGRVWNHGLPLLQNRQGFTRPSPNRV